MGEDFDQSVEEAMEEAEKGEDQPSGSSDEDL